MKRGSGETRGGLSRSARFCAACLAIAFGSAPAEWISGATLRFRETLRLDGLNRHDYERLERGYYERVIRVESGIDGSFSPRGPKRDASPFEAGPLALVTHDMREYVLKPNISVAKWGARWTTNRFGMRDDPCTIEKPAGTFRIALVGDSIGSGWGVGDGEGFEPTLERSLSERSLAAGGPRVEILNCAVPGHAPGQRWEHFRKIGAATAPDLIVYEATLADPGWDERRLRSVLARGLIAPWQDTPYKKAIATARVAPGRDHDWYKEILKPYRWEILKSVYQTIANDCRTAEIPCVWVLVPRVGREGDAAERSRLIDLARSVGFTTTLDASNAYAGIDPGELAIGPDDYHPNARGHKLLAKRIETLVLEDPIACELLPIEARSTRREGGSKR